MTDLDLLELAAKAAGINWKDWTKTLFGEETEERAWPYLWNPISDDGDALRLAVKLGMQIDTRDPETHVYVNGASERVDEYHTKGDSVAATRRAIVRAAAEIGKNM